VRTPLPVAAAQHHAGQRFFYLDTNLRSDPPVHHRFKSKGGAPPESVKSQILLHTKCVVAISLWNDDDAKILAESFGAQVLLDKMNLYSEVIPAIKQLCPSVIIPKNANSYRKGSKWPTSPSIEERLDAA
jgi:hypothetical protein